MLFINTFLNLIHTNKLLTILIYIAVLTKIILILEIPHIYFVTTDVFIFYCLTFSYLGSCFFPIITKYVHNLIVYCQLLVLSNCIDCLKRVADNKQYELIYVTFTNLNLKNYFILSGFIMYLLYFINLLNIFFLSNLFKLHLIIFIFNLFYLNYNLINNLNSQTLILIIISITIIFHIILGLYMFCFDYLKNSAFILWTTILYLIIFLTVLYFSLNNVQF